MGGRGSLYRLRPLAEADLEDIWRYTAETWSGAQAERYHAGLIAALEALASGEKTGRPVDIRDGYLGYAVASHVIFYRLAEEGIDVVRILHQRMDVTRRL